ncbi:DUF4357 domain-containing protein [Leadbettera azotonutricia]|uniref:DUF4357 domain-containing protein n=1 Tax=Leadbettera azotonutricia (strain ATCC BAA-888 / DSM 13862 / ZAS-9) TaxID=545695 RepID=F5Y9P1_LEAAZ|nr:DUF4357 domain-containing protein [Leadbettera azotonutricia]AEF81864.1 hypothetical protein TREAZ_0789 [Leadbettera azotonutricia ZAS-9]
MNNWQKLCEQVNPLINKSVDENLFHLLFESFLKTIFNWDDINIKHKQPVPMGRDIKEADIILTGEKYGIVIEMKRPSVSLGDKEAGQLTSYMRILQYKYGLLIGNKIKVYYDDDTNKDNPIEVANFDFDTNSSDGVALSEILDRNVCSNEKLKEYVIERIKRIQTKKKMELLKNELVNNDGNKIKIIIKEKLISDGYKEENINDILNDISIFLKQTPTLIENNIVETNGNEETQNRRQLSAAVIAETFHFYKRNTDAKMKILGNNDFVLLKGSKIASVVQSFSTALSNRKKYANIISPSFEILEDIHFNTPSAAGAFVSGGSENGWVEWKTKNGKSIDQVNIGE